MDQQERKDNEDDEVKTEHLFHSKGLGSDYDISDL